MKKAFLLLTVLVLTAACAQEMPEERAAELIQQSKEFSEPAIAQIYTGENVSEDYTSYAGMIAAIANGIVECQIPEGATEGPCRFTPRGQQMASDWHSEPWGAWTVYHVPTAQRKLTDVNVVKTVEGQAEVDFFWEWEPTEFGKLSGQIPSNAPQPSKARFQYDQDNRAWRLDRFVSGP